MRKSLMRARLWPWRDIGAVCVLLLFWAYLCQDILTHFFTRLYLSGSEIDMVGQIWMSWWAHKALTTPELSPFFCPYLNYPLGVEAFTYHVAFIHVMISGLLRPVLGWIGAINTMFVYGLLLSTLGMYTLLRQVTKTRLMAALFATLPIFHATDLIGFIDIEQVNFGYITFALASWLALLRRGGKFLTIITGILIGLTCITQMYYGIFLLLTLGMAVVAGRFKLMPIDQPFGTFFKRTVIATGIGIIIGIVPLLPSAFAIGSIGVYDPIPLLINTPPMPSFLHPAHLLPIPILGLLIWFTAKKDRQAWFWFLAMSIFLLLAAGPHMEIGGKQVPMPFWLLRQILPLFWRLSMPVRFGRMAIILLALFLVIYHSRLLQRFAGGKSASVLLALGLFVTANIFAPMMQGNSPLNFSQFKPIRAEAPQQIPKYFVTLGKKPQDQAAFSLRCEIDAHLSAFYQVFHQLPISGMPLIAPNLRTRLPNSELTQLQNQFCLAVENNEPLPKLPEINWWHEQNVRYLFLATTFVDAAGPGFLGTWEAAYGEAIYRYQYVHIYDLQNQ